MLQKMLQKPEQKFEQFEQAIHSAAKKLDLSLPEKTDKGLFGRSTTKTKTLGLSLLEPDEDLFGGKGYDLSPPKTDKKSSLPDKDLEGFEEVDSNSKASNADIVKAFYNLWVNFSYMLLNTKKTCGYLSVSSKYRKELINQLNTAFCLLFTENLGNKPEFFEVIKAFQGVAASACLELQSSLNTINSWLPEKYALDEKTGSAFFTALQFICEVGLKMGRINQLTNEVQQTLANDTLAPDAKIKLIKETQLSICKILFSLENDQKIEGEPEPILTIEKAIWDNIISTTENSDIIVSISELLLKRRMVFIEDISDVLDNLKKYSAISTVNFYFNTSFENSQRLLFQKFLELENVINKLSQSNKSETSDEIPLSDPIEESSERTMNLTDSLTSEQTSTDDFSIPEPPFFDSTDLPSETNESETKENQNGNGEKPEIQTDLTNSWDFLPLNELKEIPDNMFSDEEESKNKDEIAELLAELTTINQINEELEHWPNSSIPLDDWVPMNNLDPKENNTQNNTQQIISTDTKDSPEPPHVDELENIIPELPLPPEPPSATTNVSQTVLRQTEEESIKNLSLRQNNQSEDEVGDETNTDSKVFYSLFAPDPDSEQGELFSFATPSPFLKKMEPVIPNDTNLHPDENLSENEDSFDQYEDLLEIDQSTPPKEKSETYPIQKSAQTDPVKNTLTALDIILYIGFFVLFAGIGACIGFLAGGGIGGAILGGIVGGAVSTIVSNAVIYYLRDRKTISDSYIREDLDLPRDNFVSSQTPIDALKLTPQPQSRNDNDKENQLNSSRDNFTGNFMIHS